MPELDNVDRTVVTFRGWTTPTDPGTALDVLEHVADHDPPDGYDYDRRPGVDVDPDAADRARVTWSDRGRDPAVGETVDPEEVGPHVFDVGYDDRGERRVVVGLRTTREELATFDDALAHVFEAVELEPELLAARVEPAVDADGGDLEPPDGYALAGPGIELVALDPTIRGERPDALDAVGVAADHLSDHLSGASELDGETTTFSLVDVLDPGLASVDDQLAELAATERVAGRTATDYREERPTAAEMSGVEYVTVTYAGRTPPVDDETALELLRHVADYDPPADVSRAESNVADLDPASVGRGRVTWGDGRHETTEMTDFGPHFTADHLGDRVRVYFESTLADLPLFDEVMTHVFRATDLHTDDFEARLAPTAPIGSSDEFMSVDASHGVGGSDARSVSIDDLEVPNWLGVMTSGDSEFRFYATSEVLEDETAEFRPSDVVGPATDLAAQVEDLTGTTPDRTVVEVRAETPSIDDATARELLRYLHDRRPADCSAVDSPGDLGSGSPAGTRVGWTSLDRSGEPLDATTGDDPLALLSVVGRLSAAELLGTAADDAVAFAAGHYDRTSDTTLKLVTTASRAGEFDDLFDGAFDRTDLEPQELGATLVLDDGVDAGALEAPEGYSLEEAEAGIALRRDLEDLVGSTATTFSVGDVIEDPLYDAAAQLSAVEDPDGA